MSVPRILVIRLGAMGDVVHALPAVSTLRRSFPEAQIAWVIDPKWAPLLEGNRAVDQVITLNRKDWPSLRAASGQISEFAADICIDLQGLIKSALIARWSGAAVRVGFAAQEARESQAALFYTRPVNTGVAHAVDKGIALAQAAGANDLSDAMPLPQGALEGMLPESPYVLACPLAGWASKQWPLEHYAKLATLLAQRGFQLVLNGPEFQRTQMERVEGAWIHVSGLAGLLLATRKARAVVGVDSGPLHIAAALQQNGVAIFGPTDPARNGPRGGSFAVLRDPHAVTSYKRRDAIDSSMTRITPEEVFEHLCPLLQE